MKTTTSPHFSFYFSLFSLVLSLYLLYSFLSPFSTPSTPVLHPLLSGTPLSNYDPASSDYHGASVLCSVDNETLPVTGQIMTFTPMIVRILLTHPTHPNLSGIADT